MNPIVLWFHKLGSPPYFDRFARRWAPWAYALALLSMAVGAYGALFQVPADYQQGDSFRILYIHVPSAMMSMAVFALMAIYAAIALIWRIKLCEILAMACAPIGAAFTVITLATGSIWGKPMWGTWWVWDARLTSVLVLFFLYLGHMALLSAFEDPARGRKAAAVLALVGFVNVPIIKFSVDWWNTLHQPSSILRMDSPAIHSSMLWPLVVMWLAFLCYFIAVHILRTRAELTARKIRNLRLSADPAA